MIVEVTEQNIYEAAKIHSESWKESHKSFCSKAFIKKHNVERQLNYLRNEINNGKDIYMLIDNIPVGIVSVKDSLIENLYVLPNEQGKGYGTELLKFAINKCNNIPSLWILNNNEKAYKLYNKHGFIKTGKENILSDELSEIEMKLLKKGDKMRIIKPTKKYFDEYLAACKESIDNNVTEWMPLQEDEFDSWKDSALRRYKRLETGEGMPAGIPRMVTYWCIEDDRFIGEIQIRPYLTQEVAKDMGHIGYAVRHSCWGKGYGTKILKKSVKKLQTLNVTPIYIACHIDNIGSNKVCQKVGFEFVEERINSEGDKENLYILKH